LGWYHFRHGEYAKTTQYYERVFAQRAENPDYYYHLAAVAWAAQGNAEKALQYLNAAVDHGWTNATWTERQKQFSILHSTTEWDAVRARMRQAAAAAQR